MEFLLKRIPACSRALGELDSEDESTDDELTEENDQFILSDGLTVHLESVSTNRLIIALGPVQTAFVTCCFRLSTSNLLGTLSYPSPSYNVTNRVALNSLCIYHSSELHPEQPNILSGYAAEFFSFAVLRSIPTTLFVLYYANSYDPRYAWHGAKELLDQLYPIQYFLGEIPQMAEHMWDSIAHHLKENCISALSGNKPSLTDQMYT
ncbi:hypothetical protein CSKR_101387 [Clonorchis sinensis]|uniref:Proteasome assembly chaperone 1 n=1 Tax=Clonorchis sinensis TaxID=79923 RepID=A0A8T1MNN3_CLOSI|nr:hypothetical protein CSKR_101387 [Clonorchis sinensis]